MSDALKSGTRMVFKYNCDMSDASCHVELRDRSPAYVTVVELTPPEPGWENSTLEERDAAAMPFVYTIKWNDGFTHDAFEDELTPMPAEVPGLASVHINGLVHGIVREGGGISNRGPTTLYETFCGEVRATEWLDMATMKRGNQKEWPTCIGCIVLP